jgi:TP901 family phage tail tape measure protein
VAESVLRFRVETKDANAKINRLEQQVKKLEVAVKGAGGSTKVAGTGFKAFGSGAQAAAVGARGLGAALSTALGPLTAVVAGAASLGQVFGVLRQQDFSEAKVRSLGVNSKELTARLKDVSGELSGQASVLDLTAAAYDVASAGFTDAADASKILKAASQGATGGFSDINTVGDATTSVLNAYGLEADKAGRLVDGFIQTQNDGKIVIGEYAANIAKVAPVAAALGVPLEEVNAAVAQITAGGQGAEVTFTALKTAFAQVAAGKVGKEFEAFGVQINASTLKTDGLAGTLEKIKKSGADAGTVIKAFGTEAGPSILALLNDTEKYNKLLENQKESQGAAAKAAFQASDTIDGQLKRLTTAFQNLFSDQSELGVIIKETFKVAAVTVEVLAVAINGVLSPVRALFAAVNQIGIAIGEAIGVDATDAAFNLEQGFQNVLKIMRTVQTFVIGLGARIGQVLGKVFAFIANAGKSVAQSLVGVFAGLFSKITQIIQGAYNLLPPPIKNFIEGKIKGAVSRIQSFAQGTMDLGQGFTAGIGMPGAGPAGLEDAANAISPTGGKLSKADKAKKAAQDKEAQRLRKIAEQHEATKIKIQEQIMFASAVNEEERKRFERVAQIEEILRNKKELSDEQLQAELDLTHELFKQQDATQQLKDANKERADAAKKAQDEEKKRAEELKGIYQGIADTIADSFVDAIEGAVNGTKSLSEVASGVLNDLASQLLQVAKNLLFFGNLSGTLTKGGGLLGSIFGGFMASGGTATGGRSFIVGERGPELFTPGRTGSITPNNALGGSNIVVNVDASGSSVEGDSEQAGQLGKMLGAAVQAELIKQKRPGGLLA